MIDYKGGVLVLWSVPSSLGLTSLMKKLFAHTEYSEMAMPLIIVFTTLFLFSGLYIFDFILGIHASKKLNIPITNERRWESFFKFTSVVMLMFTMTIFDFLFLVMDLGFVYDTFLYLMVGVMVMICLYEFHSIGRNLEIIYGKKPKLFCLFDRMSIAIENGIIKKIGKLF